MNRKLIRLVLAFVALVSIGVAIPLDTLASPEPFPIYTCIQPNVAFWKKIYTEYESSQGIIHDKINPKIVYGVVELDDTNECGARKINRSRVKKAKNKYKGILAKLARGEFPSTPREWEVVYLFGSEASRTTFRKAMRNIRCQTGQKDKFREGIIRSGAYLGQMKKIFSSHGLPVDLVYLPHVESSFNPKAYSKFGAAGIWQFTRSTGRRFLTIDYTVDERRDPIRSTQAAALLLKSHHEKLQSWPMAITAYNHGITGMLRAKRLKGNYERVFQEYKGRRFKFASRNFYAEFLAATDVAKQYQIYFGDLKQNSAPKTQEVILPGYACLRELAEHLNTEMDVLRDFNPSLREPVYFGQKYAPKGYALRVPVDLVSSLPLDMFKPDQKASQFYTVQRGDTASMIAAMHGISLRDLIIANDLNGRATIYAGEILKLPLPRTESDSSIKLESSKMTEAGETITSTDAAIIRGYERGERY